MDEDLQKFYEQFRTEYPIDVLHIPLLKEEYKSFMVDLCNNHQIEMKQVEDGWILKFPPATVKIELFPRTQTGRYRIVLPDNYSNLGYHENPGGHDK